PERNDRREEWCRDTPREMLARRTVASYICFMTAEASSAAAGEGAGGQDPRAGGDLDRRAGADGLDAQGRRPGGLGRDIFGHETDLCTDHMVAGPFTVPSYQPEGLVELVRAAQCA